ncbi:MAG: FAD-binding protein, partial [Chloroflexi bacterium]|nr:FAD-binding protein [Chloroflexota bacterium]
MKTTGINSEALGRDLKRLLGGDKVRTEPEDLLAYSSDATRYYAQGKPDAVAQVESVDDVCKLLKYANQHGVPVTPRGAGSGLSGGSTPIRGGIVLDMKRMNRILEISKGNMTARAESGVVLANFHRAVEKEKLFYPPDPQSMDVCTLGGNVACRAGGPRGVKYGTTPNYVLGLEAVLPDGSVINTGGISVKQANGYNITQILTGSEGTLAVITRVNLRLLPLPPERKTMIVVCDSAQLAAEMVSRIIYEGVVPAVLEYLEVGAIWLMNTYSPVPVAQDGQVYLLIEVDGTAAVIAEDIGVIKGIAEKMGAREIKIIEDKKQAEGIWKARKNLSPLILRIFQKSISEDVTVPRDKIPQMVKAVREIGASLGVPTGMSGHAGDGNIHPGVQLLEVTPEMEQKAEEAIRLMIEKGIELGGTVSGEHGIGLHKSQYIEKELGKVQIELMKRIKYAFDPKGIMNPGKIWME